MFEGVSMVGGDPGIDLDDDGTEAYRQKQDYIFKYGLDGLGVSGHGNCGCPEGAPGQEGVDGIGEPRNTCPVCGNAGVDCICGNK